MQGCAYDFLKVNGRFVHQRHVALGSPHDERPPGAGSDPRHAVREGARAKGQRRVGRRANRLGPACGLGLKATAGVLVRRSQEYDQGDALVRARGRRLVTYVGDGVLQAQSTSAISRLYLGYISAISRLRARRCRSSARAATSRRAAARASRAPSRTGT